MCAACRGGKERGRWAALLTALEPHWGPSPLGWQCGCGAAGEHAALSGAPLWGLLGGGPVLVLPLAQGTGVAPQQD